MRIVHVEDSFHPDAGYQINIMPKYLSQFGHDVYIVTSQLEKINNTALAFFDLSNLSEKDNTYTEKTGVKIIRIPPRINHKIIGRVVQSKELYKTVESLNPDVIYVHGNDTFTGIRYILFNKQYPLVTDSHMLNMASINRFSVLFQKAYRSIVTPKLIKNKIPVIRTQDDSYVERCLGIPLSQAPWVSYGTDTLLFHRDINIRHNFRTEIGISEDNIVFIYTGKMDEAKGGKLLAKAFFKKFRGTRDVVLMVVGKIGNDEYGQEVDCLLKKSENRIIRFTTQKYSDLPKFYQSADVSIFAKQCSLSFYDAQGCGLPVISEGNNINIDRNSHGNGLCFSPGSVEDFRIKIQSVIDMSNYELQEMSNNAYRFITEKYNYEDKAKEYEAIICCEYERFHSRCGLQKVDK